MKRFLRPYRSLGVLVLLGAWAAMAPPGTAAQTQRIFQQLKDHTPLLHSNSQGYLGVDLADVDQQKAQALKLREVRGAVITLIDHDAPAGKIGLKVNDVVLQLNGQKVANAERLRLLLKEIPAGRSVSIEISRDGNIQTLAVQLADRRAMERDVWNKIGTSEDGFAQEQETGGITGEGAAPQPGGFHVPLLGSLNVGALVEPLTGQMAEYLGVPNGLMVKQVARKSEAAAAGLKAFDVILKVGTESISTSADWERALHANTGKPVQVTILRDRKQQTLTMQVDSKRKTGLLEMEDVFGSGECPLMAEIDPELEGDALAAAEMLRKQAEALRDKIKIEDFTVDQKQLDELKKQMGELGKNMKIEDFKVDPKQMEKLKKQMEEFRKSFKMEDLQVAPY